jgi:hypothetical protein
LKPGDLGLPSSDGPEEFLRDFPLRVSSSRLNFPGEPLGEGKGAYVENLEYEGGVWEQKVIDSPLAEVIWLDNAGSILNAVSASKISLAAALSQDQVRIFCEFDARSSPCSHMLWLLQVTSQWHRTILCQRSGEVQTYLYPKLNCHRIENCGNGFVLWYVE